MTREAFRELVKNGPVILDGATGTNLQDAGMPVGVCPEQWLDSGCLEGAYGRKNRNCDKTE